MGAGGSYPELKRLECVGYTSPFTIHNVSSLRLLTFTLQYDDYIICWDYDIQPSAFLVYGLALLETALHPLPVDAAQTFLS
jgi:hypothetical protein